MDSSADPEAARDEAVGSPDPRRQQGEHGPAEEGASPSLTLDGFSGPLDHLLTLARAQKIDLMQMPLGALIDQLASAVRQAPAAVPLGQKSDWVVMAAWLVQLRSRLLLPADAPAQQQAAVEADKVRSRLAGLDDIQALADWLERRPQPGRDVFVRGLPPSRAQSPEIFGHSVAAGPVIDVVEFLWASLALFDDAAEPETAMVYRPARCDLYAVADARERIRRVLAGTPDGVPFERLLPEPAAGSDRAPRSTLRRRSAWTSTLVASLELARQNEVVLEQAGEFRPIHVVRM